MFKRFDCKLELPPIATVVSAIFLSSVSGIVLSTGNHPFCRKNSEKWFECPAALDDLSIEENSTFLVSELQSEGIS